MPTDLPRVQVTLSKPLFATVTRLAQLQGRSRSAVISELVDEIHPVLQRVVVVLEAAAHAQTDLKTGLRRSYEQAEAEILPHVEKAMAQFDWLTRDTVDKLQASSGQAPNRAPPVPPSPSRPTPVPVTRGSGHRKHPLRASRRPPGKRSRKPGRSRSRV